MNDKTINFINKAKAKHGNLFSYGNTVYENSKTKVTITCKKHGDFQLNPYKHLSGRGCQECGRIRMKNSRKRSLKEYIRLANIKHDNKYNYDKTVYKGSRTNITITCIIHGDFIQLADSHLRGHGCPKCAHIISSEKQLKSKEQFIEDAIKVHGYRYDYSEIEYNGLKSKIKIRCEIHGYFFQYPGNHLKGYNCEKCGFLVRAKSTTLDSRKFIEMCKEIHGDIYDYSLVKYKKSKIKVKIICKYHDIFEQTPDLHLRGGNCPKCVGGVSYTKDDFIEKSKKIHGNKFDYSYVKYVNSNTKVTIMCKKHKKYFKQTPNNHYSSKLGCLQCQNIKIYDTKSFINEAKKVHGGMYDYSLVKYINQKIKVKIICDKHGEFCQLPRNHISGKGCKKCTTNFSIKGIKWIKYYSKKYNLIIQHAKNGGEYRIPGTNYYADGYSEKTKTIFEFYGKIWHGCPKCTNSNDINPISKRKMNDLYQYTMEREKKIKNLGYKIISIWEHEWDEIKKTLNEK